MFDRLGLREFTIEGANALVPTLAEVMDTKRKVGDRIQKLVVGLTEHMSSEPTVVEQRDGEEVEAAVIDVTLHEHDDDDVRRLKRALRRSVRRYRDNLERIEALGAVITDEENGSVELLGRIDGRPVRLCWTYGAPGFDHYHELAEDSADNKPLGAEVRSRQLN
ncbi:MAG: DUF2203 family protein [Myxococcota bacterium]